MIEQSGASSLDPEAAEAIAAVQAAGGLGALTAVLGVVMLIMVPLLLVVAYGLFQRKAWARQGTIIVAAISAVTALINLGGGGISIVSLVISAFVLYLFLTDEGIKLELSQ